MPGSAKPRGGAIAALAAAPCLIGSVVPADAHRTWANGLPVPAWVAKACCGPGEAHHLSLSQVHRVPDGYRIDGYPKVVYDAQVLPSEDGEYWAFYAQFIGADGQPGFTSVFCFFAPALG